jgi:hypothetical protein
MRKKSKTKDVRLKEKHDETCLCSRCRRREEALNRRSPKPGIKNYNDALELFEN